MTTMMELSAILFRFASSFAVFAVNTTVDNVGLGQSAPIPRIGYARLAAAGESPAESPWFFLPVSTTT